MNIIQKIEIYRDVAIRSQQVHGEGFRRDSTTYAIFIKSRHGVHRKTTQELKWH